MKPSSDTLLDTGDAFPAIELQTLDHGTLSLPTPEWTIVLFYRGVWWPPCNRQLVDFQENLASLTGIGVKVVAASVDPEEDARKMQSDMGATFPIAYGVSAETIRERYGAFLAEGAKYIHATGFIVDPEGKVSLSVYGSSAIGRLTAADCKFMIDWFQSQA